MTTLVWVTILIALVAITAIIFFLQTRKVFREQKGIERGLKMVPLFIHLPPPSEDVEGGGPGC